VTGWTHAADPLGNMYRVTRVLADEQVFKAAKEHAAALGIVHHPARGGGLDLQVPFQAGSWINGDRGHMSPL